MSRRIPVSAREERALSDWESEGGSTAARADRVHASSAAGGNGAATGLRTIAVIGNHLPRQCGIATFTTDLSQAIGDEFPALDCFVLAMNEAGRRYTYPKRVRFEIAADDAACYRRAADLLNTHKVDVVSVQHEYGIFGGQAGSHILTLLQDLHIPVVTTLHTILASPTPRQRVVMNRIVEASERLVVMSVGGVSTLREVHGVQADKIDLIPHGIPALPDAESCKTRLGLRGKRVLLTFGLLSPDKGIEHVIDALPAILARFPDTVYVLLGATHPHVKAQQGETYRVMLENRARRLRVEGSTIFDNRFVSQEELTEFIAAADIYVTTSLNPEQSTSGTLAYAVGCGKATVSTPYAYARELLGEGRGIVVPWPRDDPHGIARAVVSLLASDDERLAMCKRSSTYGSDMQWPAVARAYVDSWQRACDSPTARDRAQFRAKTLAERPPGLPEIKLSHLSSLSDGTGILHHAVHTVPRYADGYCVDDNARALLLTALLEDGNPQIVPEVSALGTRYLAFLEYAFDPTSGRFKNFMSYSRSWLDEVGSEDCQGRALWALGSVIRAASDPGRRRLAITLFEEALGPLDGFTSPRAWAYALLGLDEYLSVCFLGNDEVRAIRDRLATRLLAVHRQARSGSRSWFEGRATHCNARLSQALIASGVRLRNDEMTETGLRSLRWLSQLQLSPSGEDYFVPVGSNGFHREGGLRDEFDQQPVEAGSMVSACLTAHRLTGDGRWAKDARRAFNWFLGQNQLRRALYDATTGGCRDGLHPDRPNENQGAESTVSFLLALVEMRSAFQVAPSRSSASRRRAASQSTIEERA